MAIGPCTPLICAEDLPASGACLDQVDTDVIDDACDEASFILWQMSHGRVYGTCEAVIRPLHDCRYIGRKTLQLGVVPIQRVMWVMIEGAVLDPSAYKIRGSDKLVRVDGEDWPTARDLDADWTEPDTFAVKYRYGHNVDPVTKRAATDLALELIKLAVPDSRKKLPGNVTNASSQGLSLTMQDRNLLVREMGSYLESVNRFMSLWNPHHTAETVVFSPDTSPRLSRFSGSG